MNLEVRNNKVIIDGYVNAVDRFSKPIKERRSVFIEKIMPGAFKKSLAKNPDVEVLLDHDKSNVLAKTSDGTAKIYEDNIGLRANVEISDKYVLEKAKKGLLSGWSFGFVCLDEDIKPGTEYEERTIKDLILSEVSIIDERQIPCYSATSIEVRSNKEEFIEYRSGKFEATIERKEEQKEQQINYEAYHKKIKKLEEVKYETIN